MENISSALLDWFYKNQRSLPFRTDPSPYHVWLSEIMLQQTRVSAALPYYERFLAALPDIPALAACGEEKLHKLWEGLGYYSRVRNLQKAAKLVCAQYGGELPADYDALRALPGIGEYTAGAIASISFGLPVPAVDGNVLRVFSRLYNDPGVITEPAVKKAFTARVMEHQPPEKAGDYNQALMELGALVCVPNGAPLCGQCPLAEVCRARAAGTAPELPHKAAPKPRRMEPVTLALLESPAGFLLQQRPAKGLLAGLWQPVLWEGEALAAGEVLARLRAMGLDTGCAAPDALPAANEVRCAGGTFDANGHTVSYARVGGWGALRNGSVTVTDALVFDVADHADPARFLDVSASLQLADGATVVFTQTNRLTRGVSYTLAKAKTPFPARLTSNLPTPWTVYLTDGGTTLKLHYQEGSVLFLR